MIVGIVLRRRAVEARRVEGAGSVPVRDPKSKLLE
jgi:hypothetical protein